MVHGMSEEKCTNTKPQALYTIQSIYVLTKTADCERGENVHSRPQEFSVDLNLAQLALSTVKLGPCSPYAYAVVNESF